MEVQPFQALSGRGRRIGKHQRKASGP